MALLKVLYTDRRGVTRLVLCPFCGGAGKAQAQTGLPAYAEQDIACTYCHGHGTIGITEGALS